MKKSEKNEKYCVQNPVRLGQSRLDNKVKKKDSFCLKVVHRNETSKLNTFCTQKAYASDFAFTGEFTLLKRLNA